MIPIVIPLHPKGGKFGDNTEVKYAIRAIQQHFNGSFHLAIASKALPEWAKGIELIDDGGQGLKTTLVMASRRFPDGFFWWYDDCILLHDQNPGQLQMTPANAGWGKVATEWAEWLESVRQRLTIEGHQCFDYSRPHGPYWFTKAMVDEAFEDWPGMAGKFPFETWILNKRRWPYRLGVVKQYYGGFSGPPPETAVFMNFCDNGFTPELQAWLANRFPRPSAYEAGQAPRIEVRQAKRALSFSLYGDKAVYPAVLLDNITLASQHYPGWDVVVHVQRGHYAARRLTAAGARVIEHPASPGHTGMKWRYETALDGYEATCFRDADSRVNPREAAAVNEWLATGKPLHVMRDHRKHRKVMMGGMWGILGSHAEILRPVTGVMTGHYGADEEWLAANVWPVLGRDAVVHSSREGSGFPAHDPWDGFVGRQELPALRGKGRVVLLSARHYLKRREGFLESFKQHGGFLNGLQFELREGTPVAECYCPPSFKKLRQRPHWWAATCDHVAILKESLIRNDDWLFVFEDDIRFEPDFNEMFWRAWCALPTGWKALRLHWNARFNGMIDEVIEPGVLDRCCINGQGMAGTFWDRSGIYRFYDHYHHRMKMLIDEAFEDLRRREKRDWYQPRKKVTEVGADCVQRGKDA